MDKEKRKFMLIIKNKLKKNKPDKPWTSFLALYFLVFFILFLILILSIMLYLGLLSHFRNIIAMIMLVTIGVLFLFLLSMFIALVYVYHANTTNSYSLFLSQIGLQYLMPILILLSKHFRNYNDILLFYINLNNVLVKSSKKKYFSKKTLVLLPHCLQNPKCPYKITGFISNCRKCLRCDIGHILLLSEKHHIPSIEVVTGGTAARSAVMRNNPELIIAIACERDLASGIAETKGVPVIGLLNKRPHGPCIHTCICMEEYQNTLEELIVQSNRYHKFQRESSFKAYDTTHSFLCNERRF